MMAEKHFPLGPHKPGHRHRIRIDRRATRVGAFEVFEAAHVALRTLLAFSQPVNCIFWPIGMLTWLVAASKLHKHRVTCCTAEWLFYSFLILCHRRSFHPCLWVFPRLNSLMVSTKTWRSHDRRPPLID